MFLLCRLLGFYLFFYLLFFCLHLFTTFFNIFTSILCGNWLFLNFWRRICYWRLLWFVNDWSFYVCRMRFLYFLMAFSWFLLFPFNFLFLLLWMIFNVIFLFLSIFFNSVCVVNFYPIDCSWWSIFWILIIGSYWFYVLR